MRRVATFTATIYVGFRVGRSAEPPKKMYALKDAMCICKRYCNEVGLCVTVTPTNFVYTRGGEEGVAVGFINYPRFPDVPSDIKDQAIELAKRLKKGLEQRAVTIVFPDETVMLDDDQETT